MYSSAFSLFLFLLFFLAFSCFLPDVVSSPFSTIAIASVSNVTLVCALVQSSGSLASSHVLNCTTIPGGRQETYHSSDGPYSAIAAGDGFLCGLTVPANGSSNATMRWWEFGGAGSEHKPKRVYFGPPIMALESGDRHVCGLIGSGRELQCWRWGELGAPACGNVSEIAVGRDFVCGLLDGGAIKCFGGNKAVVGKEPAGNFTMISAGTGHACSVSADGKLCCWGVGAPGPDEIPLSSVAAMALGENKTCLLRSNGTVFCLGEGAAPPGHLADKEFLSLEAKGDLICGITLLDFSVVCWGNDLLQRNNTIYSRVLPGSCAPLTSCHCDFLPGSSNMCPAGEGICLSCKLQFTPSSFPLPTPSNTTNSTSGKSFGKGRLLAVVLGPVGGILLLTLLIAVFVVVRRNRGSSSIYNRMRWRPRGTESARRAELASSSQLSSSGIEEFPIRMLLKSTENFSDAQKVGSGGFGTVYRATLPDGREVAIKRAHLPVAASSTSLRFDRQRRRERDLQLAFASEIALLSRINHKNLVRLLGFCQERRERVLVYEYMSNGTLHDHLHKHTIEPSSPLASWSERLKLALDAARGIEYLHVYAVPAIIHRDIKSSNILLDDEWTAKVSDFGVSLTSGPGEEAGAAAAGTVGYMDPEYYRLRRLTSKSDVYSFGVVLLELLTGCKAIYREEGEDGSCSSGQVGGGDGQGSSPTPKNVVEMAVPCIEADDFKKVMDRRPAQPTKEEEEAVDYVAYLASECVKSEARERPTMVDVVGALERAVMVCDAGAGRDGASRVGSMRSGFLERSGFIERSGFLDRSGLLFDPIGSASGSGWLVRREGLREES